MKTRALALLTALLVAGIPLRSQPANGPAPQPGPNQPDQNKRSGPMRNGMPPMARGEMNAPSPGGRGPQHQAPNADPVMENFFPPEMIMHHQQALNLTEEQRKRLIEVIQKSQPAFTDFQWRIEAEQAALVALARAARPDEKQIAAQLDKVLQLEGEMRRGHLLLLVRLKNELTAEQQATLRSSMHRPTPGPGR